MSSSRRVATRGMHQPDIRCIDDIDDDDDDDNDVGDVYPVSTCAGPVEFTNAASCGGVASYFN